MRRLDQIVVGGIGFLIVATPLCFGTVHPLAYSVMEQVVFALVVLWMARVWVGGRFVRAGGGEAAAAKTVAVPLVLLMGLLAVQIIPLSPSLLGLLSPTAYSTYARTLPGWPTHAPYRDVDFNLKPKPSTGPVILPTARQVRAGAPIPFAYAAATAGGPSHEHAGASTGHRTGGKSPAAAATQDAPKPLPNGLQWRSISFEPGVTRSGLLKALAYAALFLLVALYPFGTVGADGKMRSEVRFNRILLGTILATGFVMAFLGLANWASWNGKILWFFVPYDWSGPITGFIPRATGPFVDPDHFANYLAMILPLALAGALFRTDLVPRKSAGWVRLASTLVAFFVVCAILLSLSRAGWVAAALGVAVLIALFFAQPERRREAFAPHGGARTLRWTAAGMVALCVFALLLIGPQGRNFADVRLSQTVSGGASLSDRLRLYRGSLAMIRDFPLFGVGLGSWGELFTRYASPPWSRWFFYREAHNDYLQFIDEAGLLAFVALLWLAWRILRRMVGELRRGDPRKWPILAAVLAAAAATAFHETVDFNLHIPANAVLLMILLGLGLRTAPPHVAAEDGDAARAGPRLLAASAAAAAILLIFISIGQKNVAYPDFLTRAKTLRAAVAEVIEHPADSRGHFIVARLGTGVLSPKSQLREIRSAMWLDPTNPSKRDWYAHLLARHGKLKQALPQVTRSVFDSPSVDTHFYLSPKLVGWLAPPTRRAVEKGFRKAIAKDFPGALTGMGEFYARTHRPLKEANLYAEAAREAKDPSRRERFLLEAGQAYAAAGYASSATALYRAAIEEAPGDPRPYMQLVKTVYGPDRDMRSAKSAIGAAINAGGDPYELNLALAEAASRAHDAAARESALKAALNERPDGIKALSAIGEFYIEQGNYDRAAVILERASDLEPDSASIVFHLGRAQEKGYHYYQAEKSYARAAALSPKNGYFSSYYSEFKQRMAKEAKQNHLSVAPGSSSSTAVPKTDY